MFRILLLIAHFAFRLLTVCEAATSQLFRASPQGAYLRDGGKLSNPFEFFLRAEMTASRREVVQVPLVVDRVSRRRSLARAFEWRGYPPRPTPSISLPRTSSA